LSQIIRRLLFLLEIHGEFSFKPWLKDKKKRTDLKNTPNISKYMVENVVAVAF